MYAVGSQGVQVKELAVDFKVITAPGSRRIIRMAFDYAKRNGKTSVTVVTKANVVRACAICERTLLMGEHAVRFSPNGEDFVDVCPLCNETALDHGWVREGLPFSPALQQPFRRRRSLWSSLLGARPLEEQPVVEEPLLRRLTDDEVAIVEAAELFNASTFLRTVNGVAPGFADGGRGHTPVLAAGWRLWLSGYAIPRL